MNNKVFEYVETALNGVGVAYGLDNIKTVLGIIVLSINIVILVTRGVLKFIAWYKKAKEDGEITKEEIEEGLKILDETKKDIDQNVDKE